MGNKSEWDFTVEQYNRSAQKKFKGEQEPNHSIH